MWCLILGTLLAVFVDPATKAQECATLVRLITGDQYRVTDDQISASSFLNTTHLPGDARLPSGSAWCSRELGLSVHALWLQVDFGTEIAIHTISISGSSFSHVISFHIQSSATSGGVLQYLTSLESESPHLFNFSASRDSTYNITLPTILVAMRLRILPYTWDVNPPCLRLEVYGCLLNPACITETKLSPSSALLPAENVIDSSQQVVASLLTEETSMCFNYTDKQTCITLNFTQPVIITRATSLYVQQFLIGDQNVIACVNTYTISTLANREHFTTYTDTTGRKDILTHPVNTFWNPVQTDHYLRLTITNASTVFGIVCWHLQLYGCIDSQVVPTPFLVPGEKEKVEEKKVEEKKEEVKKEVNKAVGAHYFVVPAVAVGIFILVVVCVMNQKKTTGNKFRLPEQLPQAAEELSQAAVQSHLKQLSVADLPVILEELNDACAEWYNIAMQLQVSVNKLDCIQEQCNNPTACLRKALQIWLENYTTPTWKNIVNVLRSKTVNKTRLAEELDSKYCCGESLQRKGVQEGQNTASHLTNQQSVSLGQLYEGHTEVQHQKKDLENQNGKNKQEANVKDREEEPSSNSQSKMEKSSFERQNKMEQTIRTLHTQHTSWNTSGMKFREGSLSGSNYEIRIMDLEKRVEELYRQQAALKTHTSELEMQLQASLPSTHNGSFLWRTPDVSRRKRDAIDERITSIYSPPFYTSSLASTHNGSILWRIPDVSRRRRDAIDERITAIYSPPFYTGRNGYKMCIRAYLNGDGSGHTTHLSLFFVLMKGEYDPLLKWPFDYKVSMILVDQNRRKHLVQTFKPTPESSSFQRPQTDMNVASGYPQFAKLSVLDDEDYVKENVMYIKCIVDTS